MKTDAPDGTAPQYDREEAGGRFAQLLQALVMADRAELEALAADAQCVYRVQAARVLALLQELGEPEPSRDQTLLLCGQIAGMVMRLNVEALRDFLANPPGDFRYAAHLEGILQLREVVLGLPNARKGAP